MKILLLKRRSKGLKSIFRKLVKILVGLYLHLPLISTENGSVEKLLMKITIALKKYEQYIHMTFSLMFYS